MRAGCQRGSPSTHHTERVDQNLRELGDDVTCITSNRLKGDREAATEDFHLGTLGNDLSADLELGERRTLSALGKGITGTVSILPTLESLSVNRICRDILERPKAGLRHRIDQRKGVDLGSIVDLLVNGDIYQLRPSKRKEITSRYGLTKAKVTLKVNHCLLGAALDAADDLARLGRSLIAQERSTDTTRGNAPISGPTF